jgi:hypothetical protein
MQARKAEKRFESKVGRGSGRNFLLRCNAKLRVPEGSKSSAPFDAPESPLEAIQSAGSVQRSSDNATLSSLADAWSSPNCVLVFGRSMG